MEDELRKYGDVVCADLTEIFEVLHHWFDDDILSHSTVLRQHVLLPTENENVSFSSDLDPKQPDGVHFMESLLHHDWQQEMLDYEVISFLREPSIDDKRADTF